MNCYEDHGLQNKALPFIYKERKMTAPSLRSKDFNWHENIEILYVLAGNGRLSHNGQTLPATKGDIFLINANHLHDLWAVESGFCFRYLIVDRAFCLENGFDTSCLSFDVHIRDGEACSLMEQLDEAYRQPDDTPYGVLSIRTLVQQLMLLLCRKHSTALPQAAPVAPSVTRIKRAIDHVRSAYDKQLSLESVAAFVGVSGCYLSHEFPKYTGQSFVEFVNHTRCKAAERLLTTTSLSVFEIGKRCGFENRSYFAKAFRRYTGMSPAEYRAEKGKS